MGYSIRDERWRLTLWRDRRDGSIAATELYDEQNDPAETKNLADAHPEIVAKLRVFLPALPAFAGRPAAARPDGRPKQDRAAMFERRDKNHDGKLSREEFMVGQPDPEAAKLRFDQWDTDKDGFLSRDEFIHMGGKAH